MHRHLSRRSAAAIRVLSLGLIALIVATACGGAAPAVTASATQTQAAGAAPKTNQEIFVYSGANRTQLFEEAAKKEGQVVWYSAMAVDARMKAILDAFKQKYPFIDVQATFMDTATQLSRSAEEFKGGKNLVDLFDTGIPTLVQLSQAGIIDKFSSPQFEKFPSEVKDPKGYWVAERETPLGLAFNTNSIKKEDAPKSYQDLLDPKWKGMFATTDNSQAVQFFAALLKINGEDYVRKLAAQDVTVYSTSNSALTQLTANGQTAANFPASVGIVTGGQQKGSPLGWSSLQTTPVGLAALGVATKAPHPFSTMLFVDFLLSEQGQKIVSSTGEGGTRTGNPNDYQGQTFKRVYVDFLAPADQYAAEYAKWEALFKQIFVRKAK